MLNGTVNFRATLKGNGVAFSLFEFNASEPGVDRVEIEAPNGDEIRTRVHFASVASADDARVLATKVNTTALNRIAFSYGVAIENDQMTGHTLSPITSGAGTGLMAATGSLVMTAEALRLVLSYPTDSVRAQLEQAAPPGEHNYALFRSALQATSPVEEFMFLYSLLLLLCNQSQKSETQKRVDSFIVSEDPTVPRTLSSHTGEMETVYTRLRNEVGHRRAGVKFENTRAEMTSRVEGLRALTRRAIELHP